jgi:hypothetical protein
MAEAPGRGSVTEGRKRRGAVAPGPSGGQFRADGAGISERFSIRLRQSRIGCAGGVAAIVPAAPNQPSACAAGWDEFGTLIKRRTIKRPADRPPCDGRAGTGRSGTPVAESRCELDRESSGPDQARGFIKRRADRPPAMVEREGGGWEHPLPRASASGNRERPGAVPFHPVPGLGTLGLATLEAHLCDA